jgi:hypothetical protein
MKNLILGIVAMVFFGACNSEPNDEVGRYVPLNQAGAFLDSKTGRIYYLRDYGYPAKGYWYVDAVKEAKPQKNN